MLHTLPTIDFAEFGDGTSDKARAIGQKFFAACRDVGFAYLINTGISQEAVDEMFSWSAKLFALPTEVKMKAPHPPEGSKHRGYSGIGREQVSQHVYDPNDVLAIRKGKFPDFKESFDIGSDSSSARLQNIWIPENDLPGFRSFATHFFDTCRSFQITTLLPALALGMGLPQKSYFLPYHTNAENQLRLLFYPAVPTNELESGEKGRIGAHTDFSTGTLLFQDEVGGLEVEVEDSNSDESGKDSRWIPAPPVRGAIVFNIGDFLMRWSNDTLRSTMHRVRAPPPDQRDGSGMTRERFSIPYFISADKDKTIDCLPGCFAPDRPKKYDPINAGEYVDMRLNATY